MKGFFNKIVQFFKKIKSKKEVKKLEAPKSNNKGAINGGENEKDLLNALKKKEFFEIYNLIKSGEYNLNNLDKEKAEQVLAILRTEIDLKEKKLSRNIIELNVLRYDNKNEENNRLFEIYMKIKDNNLDINNIDKEDVTKIKRIMIEEAKDKEKRDKERIEVLEFIKNSGSIVG